MKQFKIAGMVAACVILVTSATAAVAQDQGNNRGHEAAPRAAPRSRAPAEESYRGPTRYRGITEPKGWNSRPATVDRGHYQHNYRAPRSYHIGPYYPPRGWRPHHWRYGEILPRAYWGPNYLIGDYWLFSLQVPPVGYEWVREGNDALLVNIGTGEILQVEYGVFA